MRNSIKASLQPLAVALLLNCSVNVVQAQKKSQFMESSKMATTQMPYMLPQKAEDISPLLNGEKVPMAVLPDASGKNFDLNKAISTKPTVLVFYRGGWCPYCSKQLSGLQQALPELEKMGYQVIAISTDASTGLAQSAAKEKLSYTLLSDADLSLAKQFGIAYKAPKAYWDMLPKTSGGKDTELLLPVPSVFVLDKTGTIQFEYINPDFMQRLNPELLKAASAAVAKAIER